MNKVKILAFAIFWIILAGPVCAQLNYTFSQSTGTYTEITTGTIVGSSSDDDVIYISSTAGSTGTADTGTGFPIGFNFTFNGITFDRFAVSSNGYIKLGTGTFSIGNAVDGPLLSSDVSNANLDNTIMPMAMDLVGISSQSSSIRFATVGSVGARQLVVQFKAVARFAETENLNFQVRLLETTNVIEVAYGSFTNLGTTIDEASVGLRGIGSSSFHIRKVSSGWASSVAGTSSLDACVLSSTVFPSSGLIYRWTPGSGTTEPSSSPTNLVFTNITNTSFSYSFTPSSPAADGYIHIRRAGSPPTELPVDGTVYTAVSNLGSSQIMFVGAGTAFDQASVVSGTTYHYAIYAYNGSGSSINYRTVSPAIGSVTATTLATEPTAQPTSLVFSNLRADGYDFSYAAANPAPAGYIGIRGIGEEPTTPPSDGVTYGIGDAVGNGFVNFVGDASDLAWVQNNATEGTTYHLAIYSFNGSGAATNYLTTNPLRGSVTPTSDNTPPVIGTNTTPTKIAFGQTVRISVTWTDAESGVDYVELRYGPTNQFDWTDIDASMTNTSGNVWEFTIPASEVKEQGVEYQMVAYNGVGLSTESVIFRVVVDHPNGLTIPYSAYGAAQTNYRVLSIPLVLEKKSINDIFTTPLGAYDPKNWRMFRYGNGQYTEMTGTATMDVGRGYMFIAKENKGALNTGAGVTVDNGFNKPFTFTPANGWNLIGNPFNFNVRWADVQAENNALASVPLKVFNGGATFTDGTALAAFSGGFIFVNSTSPITIPHVKSGRTMAPPPPMRNALDTDHWVVDISLTSGNLVSKGGIGMSAASSEEYDQLDDFTVPRFLDFLELNHSKKLHGANYAKDVVPVAGNHEWLFEVISNSGEDLVKLSWDNSYFGSNSKQLVLWDENLQRGIDMRTNASYVMSQKQSKDFRIIYGDADFVQEKSNPRNLVFHGAYPVPATEKVTFAFSTPESSESVQTSVEVYDLLGRQVAEVLNKTLPGGYQEVVWQIDQNHRPLPGVYISVVKFGNEVAQKRLVIK